MTLDFLLKAFRKVLQKSATQNQAEPNGEPQKDKERQKAEASAVTRDKLDSATDESIDPFNPFPDPVVIEFRDVLDLHSIPPKQVRAVVDDYLEEAHLRRVPYLRIIHGKGIGVQREIVRSILAGKSFVVDFQDAPVEAGGWGATIVTLKV